MTLLRSYSEPLSNHRGVHVLRQNIDVIALTSLNLPLSVESTLGPMDPVPDKIR